MRLKFGDMFKESEADWLLFTGNAYVNARDELVMGKGAALQVQKEYPGIGKRLGRQINNTCGHLGEYLVMFDSITNIGVLQVKHHFKEVADLTLTERALIRLAEIVIATPGGSFAVNFPAIGYGGRKVSEVYPLLAKHLPDNVEVWAFASKRDEIKSLFNDYRSGQ